MLSTTVEVRTNPWATFFYGLPIIDTSLLVNLVKLAFISFAHTLGVVLIPYQMRWQERERERERERGRRESKKTYAVGTP